jgi:2-methylcitrate dehydratase PrpD
MASGSKRQFGTMAKPLHAGLAAQAAVMAATLAQNGMSAAPEAIDGEMGIRDLMAGPASPGFDKPLNRLGRPLAILENGLAAKRFPCCGSAHRSLDGLLDLRAKHRLATADVERIETVVSPINMKNLMYPEPRDETEGKFSMQYCMAAIMAQGRLGRRRNLRDGGPARQGYAGKSAERRRAGGEVSRLHRRMDAASVG